MKKLDSIILLFLCVNFSSFAKEIVLNLEKSVMIPESAQIIHYPQIDQLNRIKDKTALRREIDHKVMVSFQFSLVHTIRKLSKIYPSLKVFDEYLVLNMTREIQDNLKHIGYIFPSGFPEKFEELNVVQKILLHKIGGTEIALGLGFIDKVYATTTPEETRRIALKFNQVQIGGEIWNDLFFTQREKTLKRVVKEVLNKEGGKALIIYGADHDLSAVFNNYNFFVIPSISVLHEDVRKPYVENYFFMWFSKWLEGYHIKSAILRDSEVQDILEYVVTKDRLNDLLNTM